MYHINSSVDKPDITNMENRVRQMMTRGVAVGDLNALYNKFVVERDSIASEIQQSYRIMNPNSSKQIVAFLSNLDNAEVYEACFVDGKWTTNKDALGNLSLMGYQFATDLLDYRKAKKYAESIKSMLDAVDSDGRVHPSVSLSKTNRINYSSPALMNIPKPLLWHIIKPNKTGNILISADIKNQEPSILINILNVDSLKEALLDEKGLYEHLFTKPFSPTAKLNILVTDGYKEGLADNSDLAELGFVPPIYYTPCLPAVQDTYYEGVQVRAIDTLNFVVKPGSSEPKLPSEVTIETVDGEQHTVGVVWRDYNKRQLKSQGIIECIGDLSGLEVRCEGIGRKEFKVSWNAMTYGASSFGVEQMCKHINGKIMYDYFSKIAEFRQYRMNCKKKADRCDQYINTFFGTTLFADEPNTNKLRRVLMDLPIQGTAADILSLLIRHSDEVIRNNDLEGKLEIYYTRHDELIFEVDKDWAAEIGLDAVKQFIRDTVEHQVDNWVPFKVEVKEVKADTLYIDEDSDDVF